MCLFQPSLFLPLRPAPASQPRVSRRSSSIECDGPLPSSRLFDLALFPSFPSSCLPRSCPLLSSTWCTTAYLLLASPLNGIGVLSDGPRAELRPYTTLARFLPAPFCSRDLLSLFLPALFLFRLFAEYIARTERADAPLPPSSSIAR